MTNATFLDLIKLITEDKRYFSICKDIGGRQNCDDLYQEFLLAVCSNKTLIELEKAKQEGYLEVFAVGIIYNIWGKRKRIKSPLYKITDNKADNLTIWSAHKKGISSHEKARARSKQAVNELYKKMNSDDEDDRIIAQLLWDVCQKNIHTVSKENNTSFYNIKKRITPILKDIRRKLDE